MSLSTLFNETTLAAIESYALTEDKKAYLSTLPEGLEKNILTIITQPYHTDSRKKLADAGVPYALLDQILQRKLYDCVQSAKSASQIQDVIDELKRQYLPNVNHVKPASHNVKVNQASQQEGELNFKRLPSKIDQKENQSLQDILVNVLKENEGFVQIFSDYALRNLPAQSILSLKHQNIIYLLNKGNIFATFDEEFFVKFIRVYLEKQKQINVNINISETFWNALPTTHINKLAQSIPQLMDNPIFIEAWFASNYTKRHPSLIMNNSAMSLSQKEEKRKILLQAIQKLASSVKTLYQKSIVKQLEFELLNLDLSLEDVDLERFLKYVEKVDQPFPLFNINFNTKIQQLVYTAPVIRALPSLNISANKFLIDYLTALLQKYDPSQYSKFDSKILAFVDENTYNRIKAKVILSKGQQLQKTNQALTQNEKIIIRQQRLLTICQSNKNSYKVNEDVILKIKIKNVTKVVAKIYELNLQRHYLEKKTNINDEIDLHFLDPTYQFIYEVPNNNPFKEEIFDLAIKDIKKQRGIYVVDLDGSGISSRAIIRKGAIFCMKRVTLAGLQLKFYDESGKKIEELSLWLRGQLVKVKGSYIIPFGQIEESLPIIAVLGEYAQMLNINIPCESYRLQVTSFYNEESFIVGGKAKIILSPRLFINQSGKESQTPISLKLLKNICINVEVLDYQNLKSTISFQNVNWNYNEDYIIEIPIQNYIRTIRISGTAEITKYNGKKEELTFNENIMIAFNDESRTDDCFKDYYLKKVNGKYILCCLGMDGEKLPRNFVHIDIGLNWIPKQISYDLESDEQGQINLGSLKYAQTISIAAANKFWRIDYLPGSAQLLKRLCFKEAEKIRVPLPPLNYKLEIGTDVNLFFIIQETRLENMNKHVKIHQGYIEIPGLPHGKYNLSIFSLNLNITIAVLKGEEWESPNQIYDPKISAVYEFFRNSNNYLALGDASLQKKQNAKKVSLKIIKPETAQLNQNVKAHIFGYTFIPANNFNVPSIIEKDTLDVRYEKFDLKGNTYLSNKKLSEEASYVLNRKEQKQFVGNNLQKPHILLNRIKVRDTVQKDQEMQDKSGFRQRRVVQQNDILLMDAEPYSLSPTKAAAHYNLSDSSFCQIPRINSHNNFLSHSGLTIENIKGQTIEFNVPEYYNYLKVVLVSNTSKYVRSYYIEDSKVSTKKISHSGLQKEEKQNQAWSMSREIYPIAKGQSKKISRTSKWCGVSLLNIIQFAKTQGVYLQSWVQRWGTYSQQTKLQIYNRKACHELNSYIKHQDEPFFNKVVAPYISNKINKTFVDLCLLEDTACQQWIPLQYFNQLNIFEKVLLIEYLAKKGKNKQAQNLATALELKEKINKYSYNLFKQKFETMINAEIKHVPSSDPSCFLPPPPPPMAEMSFYAQPAMGTIARFGAPQISTTTGSAFGGATAMRNSASKGAFFMSRPIAPSAMDSLSYQEMSFSSPQSMVNENQLIDQRATYIQTFKEVQKTQQFAQVTYDQIKDPSSCNQNFIPFSKFWVDLACYFARGKNNKQFLQQNFVTESIIYCTDKRSFTLAASFLPKNLNPDYEISTQGSNIILTANKPFLLFIKQIKSTPFVPRNGLMINHRFFDPTDQYSYEQDGTSIQKQVDEFVIGKQYTLQTLATNTTGNNFEVQLLVDIPEGAIPIGTKEYTQILSFTLSPYSTQSFNRTFYFPAIGQYNLYPANVSWNKNVIAKAAALPAIKVHTKRTSRKLQTLSDLMAEGEEEDIIKYLETKNVFDTQFFRPHEILWMLKDKNRFERIIQILRNRGFMSIEIWRFGFLHNDLQSIKEWLAASRRKSPSNEIVQNPLRVFQYYPYYSSRAHKYQNENKSKIRNVQFKQTYYRFLFEDLVYNHGQQKHGFKLAAAYYLLLQDRIDQASKLVKTVTEGVRNKYKLQFDYLECFIDMYEGFPNFSKARKISEAYSEYPVSSWRVLFEQIRSTLKNYDNAVYVEEEQRKVQYQTNVINEGENLRISIPAQTRVQVLLYSINLELLYSQNPFKEVKQCSSVKPAKIVVYEAGQSREEKLKRPELIKDLIVQVFESGKSTFLRKVDSLFWVNPKLKVKINEKKGTLQVFYQNKALTSCYCKVYSIGLKGEKFYRDGYTDITGSFKYALSELKQITQFSILCISDYGGVINKIAPPSEAGELSQA